MLKKYLLLSICLSTIFNLTAQTELKLPDAVNAVISNSRDFKKTILDLQKAEAGFKENKTNLFPSLTINSPVSFDYQYKIKSTFKVLGDNEDLTTSDISFFILNPEIKLSQLIPSSATVNFSVFNRFRIDDIGNIESKYADEYIEQNDIELDPTFSNTPGFGLSISQPVHFKNAYQATVTTIKENYNIQKNIARQGQNELVYQIIKSYYNLKYLQYNQQLAGLRREDFRKRYEEAKKKLELGHITESILLQADSALKKAEIDVIDAENSYLDALKSFKQATGIKDNFTLNVVIEVLPEKARNFDEQMAIEKSAAENLEIKQLEHQLEVSKAKKITTQNQLAPIVSLGADFHFGTTKKDVTDFSEALGAPFSDETNPQVKLNLNFTWKFFDAGFRRQKRLQDQYDIDKNLEELNSKQEVIQKTVRNYIRVIKRNKHYLDYVALNSRIAELDYERGKKDLELGQITEKKLEELRIDMDNAKLLSMKAEIDHNMQYLLLYKLTGNDLTKLFIR